MVRKQIHSRNANPIDNIEHDNLRFDLLELFGTNGILFGDRDYRNCHAHSRLYGYLCKSFGR